MIRFRSVGNTQDLAALEGELVRLGAEPCVEDASLVLLGATTLEDARAILETLSQRDAERVVLVGVYESLHMNFLPAPGSFGALLETFQILGALHLEMITTWHDFGFVGSMRLLPGFEGVWYGKPFRTPSYSSWAGLEQFGSAGRFLLRLVDVFEKLDAQREP